MNDEERSLSFGRLTMGGDPMPGGAWLLTEKHGGRLTSFIALDDTEAMKLRDQINEKLPPGKDE